MMYQPVIEFWFKEIDKSLWWAKDDKFDQLIVDKFTQLHTQAIKCELFAWRKHVQGRLAEIIILDQFSRNMWRSSPLAFAYDALALCLAQEAVALGVDSLLGPIESSFLYMPYMHSESLEIQKISVQLQQKNSLPASVDFALQHQEIIAKFGRFPHRNAMLSRSSTAAESKFLQEFAGF
jgi:uncharacterized protein (DUF924 family)